MSMFLYRTEQGVVVEREGSVYILTDCEWDDLFVQQDPLQYILELIGDTEAMRDSDLGQFGLLPPIASQEVWAAGVTYRRSREARMGEAKDAGGGDFYDKVYEASRPELFFKSTAHRTVGHEQQVRIRKDSRWNVPEPELTLAISSHGRVFGYTVGNDMSSRDIEGENPLYLPQAKVYDQSCALGPRVYLSDEPLLPTTAICMEIRREDQCVFSGTTELSQIKRSFESLVEFLFRDNSFPCGCYMMTGTGIVPPDDFTLRPRDEIRITIEPIGTLVNFVVVA